jgi:hypothetical protein
MEGIEGVEKIICDLNTKKAERHIKPPEVEQTILKTLTEIGIP